MTIAITEVNVATDNFLDWVVKTNQAISAISNNAVTVGGNNAVGVAGVTGHFTSTLSLNSNTLSGGAYGSPALLTVTSNVAFSGNTTFNGANNSFGTPNTVHMIGASGQNKFVIANTTTNKLMFTTLLTEITAIDGAGSGIDADLFDGEDSNVFVRTYGSTMTNALSWGSAYASSNTSTARHIALYGSTYGFNVTSDFLNYVTTLNHRFYAGSSVLATLNTVSFSSNVPVFTPATVAGGAGLRVPHGTLPTSPVNGDLWSTTAGWFVQTNGNTQQLLTMTYLQTIDGTGSGLDADLLDGQQGSWYADIPARLGYTPVNKAGDTMSGGLVISNTSPTLSLTNGANTVTLTSPGAGVLQTSASGFIRPHVQAYSGNVAISATGATLVTSYNASVYRTMKYIVSITNNNANAHTASELLVIHNSGDAFISEYAIVHSNTSFGNFTANVNAGAVRVYFNSTSNNANIKYDATLLTV